MNMIDQISKQFNDFLIHTFAIQNDLIETTSFDLNIDPTKETFGDINANCAMMLAKELKKSPQYIANQIKDHFTHEYIKKIEVAGPGFLNLFLTKEAYQTLTKQIFTQKYAFFKPDNLKKKHFNIEFVSANPTGPLHFGHGRGGIIGDVLGNILTFLGHDVTKEFYINDAGAQITKLGVSFRIRCKQALGIDAQLPEDAYHGNYLLDLAQDLVEEQGDIILQKEDSFFEQYAKEKLLHRLKITLASYGITFDVWFSEKSLHESGAIEKALNILDQRGFLYEKDDALWFRSTEFGDDKDRVLRKKDGSLTYAAPDIAYLENKAERGFDHIIMILGHDHHGYAARLEGFRQALGIKASLTVILCQLIKMKLSGELVRMSKRAGNIVTLDDVIETVGKDVARFFYLNRKADAQLEFDLELAMKKTEENPVYYVQYAYVRTRSILEKAAFEEYLNEIDEGDIRYIDESEYFLLKKIVSLKQLLHNIALHFQTHMLTYYVLELAHAFHKYYGKNRVIDPENPTISRGRLLLISELKQTFELCLDLLGISKPEKM